MYVMLLLGMILSALVFGAALVNFSPARLVQVIQGCALATMVLNVVALWKQEARRPRRLLTSPARDPTFREAWASFSSGDRAVRRLVAVGFGTMAFSMGDILLEPYGGEILQLSVGATTKLTAALAVGGLLGFGLASRILSRGADPFRMACAGALVGLPAFVGVILAASVQSPLLFAAGTLLIGFGAGLFGHGTLTATMNCAPAHQRGLALGAWGAVQASAAGLAIAASGVIRDLVASAGVGIAGVPGLSGPAAGYTAVYGLEILLLVMTLVAMAPLIRRVAAGVGAGLEACPPALSQPSDRRELMKTGRPA
jgi:BCD family chlorophyll transporter-like MFS transporter